MRLNPIKLATVVLVAVKTALKEINVALEDDGKVSREEAEAIAVHVAARVAEALLAILIRG